MKRYFILFMTLASLCRGQVIRVIDMVSREPLPGVLIYSGDKKKHTSTNAKGQANLSAFAGNDSVYLSMVGYRLLGTSVSQLSGSKPIELSPADLNLTEVVVSANRWEEQASETPNRITHLSRRETELQNPQTAADMLESSGYVYVQKSQLAGGSPILRGFATNRVMLVVDGVRMNNAIFRGGNLQNVISLDAHAIESAEVLFGPGAVMYGSDAIGGVMDFHTLKPRFADTAGRVHTGGLAMARFSTANRERTYHADVNVAGTSWSWIGSFSRSDYDDLRTGTHGDSSFLRPTYMVVRDQGDTMVRNADPRVQVGSAFGQTNFMQKFAVKVTPDLEADHAFHYSESSNAPRYDRLYQDERDPQGQLDYAEWFYGPQLWMMNRASVTHSGENAAYDRARIIAAWQRFGESRHDRRTGRTTLGNQIERVDAYSLNVDLDKQINSRLSLFYGAEGVFNHISSTAYDLDIHSKVRTPAQTRYPHNSTWQTYGAYANLKYRITPKLILTTGARYTHYAISARFDTTFIPLPFTSAVNSNGALNGAAGVSFLPNPTMRMYVNLATGFRAPNMDDIGKVFESEAGSLVVPNKDLAPEYAYNGEAGFVKVIGKFVKIDGAAYYTLLRNALARRPYRFNNSDLIVFAGDTSHVQAIQNITQAYVYGVQAGVELDLPAGFGMSLKGSWQKGMEQSEDSLLYYPKTHVPPAFARADIFYSRRKVRVDLYSVYHAGMSYDDLSLNDRNDDVPFAKDPEGKAFVPSWYTLNAKLAWYFSPAFTITGGVENITDVLYRPFSSGISAPGRNYIVSLSLKL